ncbi:hypothetical protein [Falsibacillus pallidus]|uniref:Uncharacterized protein n=1 Tax=Falsibacillus pallidus TaxID=493781 RepID=A0A370GCQ1_9BACI|nr:hypothetical protein [Falsibacillus pallidus]RDI40956.1 hypothetical protein DFR59_111100 [Falsibacillus pallidus]
MKLFLVITQVLYLIFIVLWLPIWGLSFMSFDNGIALWNSLFVFVIGIYPLVVITCSIAAWLQYRKSKNRRAVIIDVIPLLWILGLLSLVII